MRMLVRSGPDCRKLGGGMHSTEYLSAFDQQFISCVQQKYMNINE